MTNFHVAVLIEIFELFEGLYEYIYILLRWELNDNFVEKEMETIKTLSLEILVTDRSVNCVLMFFNRETKLVHGLELFRIHFDDLLQENVLFSLTILD